MPKPDNVTIADATSIQPMIAAVKVAGDWEIDVNATPFNSTDSDGQYFDASTDIMPDAFQTPVIIYQHGIQQGAKGYQDKPIVIGRTVPGSLQKQADGWHIRVILDKTSEYARKVWEAVKNGVAAVSSDSISHLARLDVGNKQIMYEKNRKGRIAVWPLAGVSLWEKQSGNLQPASQSAYALPAMKAIYREAGIPFPDLSETTDGDLPEAAQAAAKRARSRAAQQKAKQILKQTRKWVEE